MKYRVFVVMLIFFLGIQFSYSYEYKIYHTGADSAIMYYCSGSGITSPDTCATSTGSFIDDDYSSYPLRLNYFDSEGYHKKFFTMKENKRVVAGLGTQEGANPTPDTRLDDLQAYFTPYLVPSVASNVGGFYSSMGSSFNNKDLDGNKCKVEQVIPLTTQNYEIRTSLNPLTKITSGDSYHVPEEILEEYYYMKAFVFARVYVPGSNENYTEIFMFPNELRYGESEYYDVYQYGGQAQGDVMNWFKSKIDDLDGDRDFFYFENYLHPSYADFVSSEGNLLFGSSDSVIRSAIVTPYVLLRPDDVQVTFDLYGLEEELQYECESNSENCHGEYDMKVYVVPIDGKCDFNLNDVVDVDSESVYGYKVKNNVFTINSSFEPLPDADADGIIDEEDNCPATPWYSGNSGSPYSATSGQDYSGCPYQYDLGPNGCMGGASFYQDNFQTDAYYQYVYSGGGDYYPYLETSVGNKDVYYRNFNNVGSERLSSIYPSGYVPLNPTTQFYPGFEFEEGYVSFYLSKSSTIPIKNCHLHFNPYLDSPTPVIPDAPGTPGDPTNTSNSSILPPLENDFPDTVMDNEGLEGYDDTNLRLKVKYNPIQDKLIFLNRTGELEELNLDAPANGGTIGIQPKKIKVFRNGVLRKQENISYKRIALYAHKIKKFKNTQEVVSFVTETKTLMEKFNISKNLTYDSVNDKTSVKIELKNIPEAEQSNITIYQIIPKSVAASTDDINFISDGGGIRFIQDKDPVIGWYFNDSETNETIEYETDGDTSGGTIIITQEPILYNEGELIINYREDACNPDEAYLFDIDDLEDSNVYNPGSGRTYKVCIAHVTETLHADALHNLVQHIFMYDDSGNVSLDDSQGSLSVDFSVDNSTSMYFDMRIQAENPTGNYSCLGSIENNQDSYFGDCGYTLNRIWLHLGRDLTPPNSSVSYPIFSHTVRVRISASDNIGGSEIDSVHYCVDEDNTCVPSTEYTGEFTTTCPYDWGCIKYIRFFATDIEGNVETINSEQLRIIEKGSSCQSDCTAIPSPGRYLKECRNLNGCEYYPLASESGDDKGKAVAQSCDFLTKGSWVQYDLTQDIQCPNGPFRATRYTNEPVDPYKGNCEHEILIEYPVFLEGESM